MASKPPQLGPGPRGPSDLKVAAETAGRFALGRVFALKALIPLVVGAAFLTTVWELYTDQLALKDLTERLTAETQGIIEHAWWEIDFDPGKVDAAAVRWEAVTRPRVCVAVSYPHPSVDGPASAVFCRRWSKMADIGGLPLDHALGTAQRLPWRDAEGEVEIAFRFGPAALAWMNTHPAWDRYHFDIDDEPTTRQAFEAELDQPAEHLLAAWSRSDRIPLIYNPEDSSEALPALLVQEEPPFSPEALPLLIVPAVAGGVAWAMGCFLYFFTSPRWLRVVVVVVTLALLPWWGTWVWRGLDTIWPGVGDKVSFIGAELLGTPPSLLPEAPDYRGAAGHVHWSWNLQTSEYAPVFAGLNLRLSGDPREPEAALRALVDTVREQLESWSDTRLVAVFEALTALERRRRTEAGLLFMEAAHRLSLDETRAPAVGRAALTFLRQQVGFGGFVSAYREAPNARLELWRALLDHPDRMIRHDVEQVIERSRNEWAERGWAFP